MTVNGLLKDVKSGSEMFCDVPTSYDVPLTSNIEAFSSVSVIGIDFIVLTPSALGCSVQYNVQ